MIEMNNRRVLDVREHINEVITRKKKARAFYKGVSKSSRSYALYDKIMGWNDVEEEQEE